MAVKKKPKKKKKEPIKSPEESKAVPEKSSESENKEPNSSETRLDDSQLYEQLLSELPDRRARLVQEYLVDLNKQKAGERAGYNPHTAMKMVSKILKNVTVQKAVEVGKRLIAKRIMINQDEVIKELALIGFADMKDFVTVDSGGSVCVNPLDTLGENKSRIIKKIKEKRTIKSCQGTKDKPSEDVILESTLEFELHDKVKSLLGILDRVKPGADDPQKHEVTHRMVNMPPEPKSIEEWEKEYFKRRQAKEEGK